MILLVSFLGSLTKSHSFVRTSDGEPIAIECLAGVLIDSGFETNILTGNITEENFGKSVNSLRPKIIGLSVYTYTYNDCITFAKMAKKIAKENYFETFIVFGGPHPSSLPYEVVKEKYVDYVVVGEGEYKLRNLVAALENGHYNPEIAGVITKSTPTNANINNTRIDDLDKLPNPFRSKDVIEKSITHQIIIPPPSLQKSLATVYYSRGCTSNCFYCNSKIMYGTKVYWKSPEKVASEIKQLMDDYGSNLFFFSDLNLNLDRSHLLKLCTALRPLHTNWWGMFNPVLLDSELLSILKSSGCVKLSIGIETFRSKGVNENVKKHFGLNNLKTSLDIASQLGFAVKAYVIIALPDDLDTPEEVIKRELAGLFELPIDELRVSVATPFPGTKFYETCIHEDLISQEPNWEKFTTEELVYKHPKLNNMQVKKIITELICEYYESKHYLGHIYNKISNHNDMLLSYIEFFHFLSKTSSTKLKCISKKILNYLNNNFNQIR